MSRDIIVGPGAGDREVDVESVDHDEPFGMKDTFSRRDWRVGKRITPDTDVMLGVKFDKARTYYYAGEFLDDGLSQLGSWPSTYTGTEDDRTFRLRFRRSDFISSWDNFKMVANLKLNAVSTRAVGDITALTVLPYQVNLCEPAITLPSTAGHGDVGSGGYRAVVNTWKGLWGMVEKLVVVSNKRPVVAIDVQKHLHMYMAMLKARDYRALASTTGVGGSTDAFVMDVDGGQTVTKDLGQYRLDFSMLATSGFFELMKYFIPQDDLELRFVLLRPQSCIYGTDRSVAGDGGSMSDSVNGGAVNTGITFGFSFDDIIIEVEGAYTKTRLKTSLISRDKSDTHYLFQSGPTIIFDTPAPVPTTQSVVRADIQQQQHRCYAMGFTSYLEWPANFPLIIPENMIDAISRQNYVHVQAVMSNGMFAMPRYTECVVKSSVKTRESRWYEYLDTREVLVRLQGYRFFKAGLGRVSSGEPCHKVFGIDPTELDTTIHLPPLTWALTEDRAEVSGSKHAVASIGGIGQGRDAVRLKTATTLKDVYNHIVPTTPATARIENLKMFSLFYFKRYDYVEFTTHAGGQIETSLGAQFTRGGRTV